MLVVDEVRPKVPGTIYKKKFGPHITLNALAAAMKLATELAESKQEGKKNV